MIQLHDIHPLTGFLRDHKSHLARLASTGRPEVLTVNGKARVVIQDAHAYQRMLEALETVEAARVLRARIASVDRGEPGVPAEEVIRDVATRIERNGA